MLYTFNAFNNEMITVVFYEKRIEEHEITISKTEIRFKNPKSGFPKDIGFRKPKNRILELRQIRIVTITAGRAAVTGSVHYY